MSTLFGHLHSSMFLPSCLDSSIIFTSIFPAAFGSVTRTLGNFSGIAPSETKASFEMNVFSSPLTKYRISLIITPPVEILTGTHPIISSCLLSAAYSFKLDLRMTDFVSPIFSISVTGAQQMAAPVSAIASWFCLSLTLVPSGRTPPSSL